MKKILLLTFGFVVLAFSSGIAGVVNKEDARKVAINAFYEKVNQYDQGISFADVIITYDHTTYLDGIPAFYAFDFTNDGFMIISADDAYDPVIGYSFRGEFPKGEHAYVYSSYMQGYVDQIAYIRENNIQPEAAFAAEWKHFLTDEISNLNIFSDPKDVDPLLTSTWNQDSPYNLMCPEDAGGSGGHTYVGCVATAMSTIMHYYRYPINGTGDHCYTPGNPAYGLQCADFENTYYQWNGMMDDINSNNPWPIAELGYHCAVSVNMNFGPDGSGSYSSLVPNRLNAFWRYNNTVYLEKSNFSLSSWIAILKGEVDVGRPIYYSGYSTGGGHAFVCDGYQSDNFHFNFGWSGYGNGYYSLSNVGGFYIGQACVKNFYPSDPDYPYYASGQEVITQPSGQFTDGSGPIEDIQANTDVSWLIDPQNEEDSITDITIYFVEFDLGSGDYLRIYDGETTSAPMLGEYTGSTLPTQHTSTGNKLLITLNTDGSGNGNGFKAEFYSDFPDYCSGLLEITDAVGTFDDGSGSFHYAPGATCMFRIKPLYASNITVHFNYFDTEEGKDFVKVFDGNTPLGTFSGTDIPGPFVCESEFVFITWSSNSTLNYPGWEITYEIGNVGVEEEEAFTKLEIFPNPATDALNVNFKLDGNQTVEMRLVNVTGKAVYTDVLTNVSGVINNSIDVSDFAKGIYILNLTSTKGSVNKKVIIK
ncbi:MAG: C10 family peptidase [Bacteroidales bacterium]|nr:C10 family peptidase [Bacteroidales bacterium]